MTQDDATFGGGIELEMRCVKCRSKRDVPMDSTKRTLSDASGDDSSVRSGHILVTPEPCRCGETRVRAKLKFDFVF